MDHKEELKKMEEGNSSPGTSSRPPNDKDSSKAIQKIVKKPAKRRDTNVNEDTEREETSSEDEKEIVSEVLNRGSDSPKKSDQEKAKKKIISARVSENVSFGLFRIEEYIDSNFSGIAFYIVLVIYMALGFLLILSTPLLILIIKNEKVSSFFSHVSDLQGTLTPAQENFKFSFYLAAMFVTYLLLRELFNQSVYIMILLYRIFNKKITRHTKGILLVINDVKHYIVMFFFFIFAMIECNMFLEAYSVGKLSSGYGKLGGYSFVCAILLGMLIAEKILLRSAVMYFGNNVFSERIGDVNLKMAIIRRLFIYADAVHTGDPSVLNLELLTGLDVTDRFLIHTTDFRVSSRHHCKEVVQTIFQRLSVERISEEQIQNAFGQQSEEVLTYLLNSAGDKEGEPLKEVPEDLFIKIAQKAYSEKLDLKRTLMDRDRILDKLDVILMVVVLISTTILSTSLIGFDPIKYMAGVIPLIMSSGWLFSDIIKEVFNNFIFLLHQHPYDIGDKIIAKGEELTVLRIDLMYSTFTSRGGTVCYIPNKELITAAIHNVRRSDVQTEVATITVEQELSTQQIGELREKLFEVLKKKELLEKKIITVQDFDIAGGHTHLIFKIQYLCNFRDPEPKFVRRLQPLDLIHDLLRDCGYTFQGQKTAYTV
ncbi:hypothetical protein NEFER03_1533 [Nematocida sp. LUAm3]|nr:hypothetical protein NEFER03_1533 [Nematocida sp. LUAm3]KAI5174566.1 hypothetical protein NEFER02_0687 [Nematocida sp. LUAm2]KAI5178028.1 hypothetical protein NEFER01_1210 [Nematocida sp. LUAm1]